MKIVSFVVLAWTVSSAAGQYQCGCLVAQSHANCIPAVFLHLQRLHSPSFLFQLLVYLLEESRGRNLEKPTTTRRQSAKTREKNLEWRQRRRRVPSWALHHRQLPRATTSTLRARTKAMKKKKRACTFLKILTLFGKANPFHCLELMALTDLPASTSPRQSKSS